MRASRQYAEWADQLIGDPDVLDLAAWPRAAAFLGRSALEAAMLELWESKSLDFVNANWRAQLLCLPSYIDPRLAADMAFAYSALSSACHYHPYDLPPTAPEIRHWLEMVDELITATTATVDSEAPE